jgi:hypothetical protein
MQKLLEQKLNTKSIIIITAVVIMVTALCVVGIFLITRAKQSSLLTEAGGNPCAAQNILEEVKKVYDRMHKFDDYSFVANLTPQDQLALPIMQMQDVRYELEQVEIAECVQPLQKHAINYMNSVIIYLAHFMGGVERQQVNVEIVAADEFRSVYDAELARLTGADLVQATTTPLPQK